MIWETKGRFFWLVYFIVNNLIRRPFFISRLNVAVAKWLRRLFAKQLSKVRFLSATHNQKEGELSTTDQSGWLPDEIQSVRVKDTAYNREEFRTLESWLKARELCARAYLFKDNLMKPYTFKELQIILKSSKTAIEIADFIVALEEIQADLKSTHYVMLMTLASGKLNRQIIREGNFKSDNQDYEQ